MSKQDKIPDEFVDITNKKEVENILTSIYNSRMYISVWQTCDNKNINTLGFLYNYKNGLDQIQFKSLEIKDDLGFDKNKEIFFHSNFRTTIFKTKIKKQKKSRLKLDFPMSLKIEQTRENGRTRLGMQSSRSLVIALYTEDGSKALIECQILDYSNGGIGLLIPVGCAPFINTAQVVEIENSNIPELGQRCFCVKSICPIDNVLTGTKYLRIGGEFTEKTSLPDKTILT